MAISALSDQALAAVTLERMRKTMKRKRRSCALCKPHKTGGANRWRPREAAALREFQRDARRLLG